MYILAPIFWPISLIYGFFTWLRNLAYDFGIFKIYKSNLRVISVGNLTAGGNGKTPVTIYLANLAKTKGHKPVILSRGYGGKLAGPHLVDTSDSYLEVGDEPLLMAKLNTLTVVIAKDRVAGAKFIEKNKLGDLIILDDGFQHRRLARDIDYLCVNWGQEGSERDFYQGRLLPYGRFRESKRYGLQRATALFLVSREIGREIKSGIASISNPQILSMFTCAGVENISGATLAVGSEVVGFSTIANPDGFRSSIVSLGYQLKNFIAFNDHQQVNLANVIKLLEADTGTAIICTEKDLVKLGNDLPSNIYALKVAVTLPDAEATKILL